MCMAYKHRELVQSTYAQHLDCMTCALFKVQMAPMATGPLLHRVHGTASARMHHSFFCISSRWRLRKGVLTHYMLTHAWQTSSYMQDLRETRQHTMRGYLDISQGELHSTLQLKLYTSVAYKAPILASGSPSFTKTTLLFATSHQSK
eukprot:1142283-Pelagomonas_calceolata.AAC.1